MSSNGTAPEMAIPMMAAPRNASSAKALVGRGRWSDAACGSVMASPGCAQPAGDGVDGQQHRWVQLRLAPLVSSFARRPPLAQQADLVLVQPPKPRVPQAQRLDHAGAT